MSGSNNSYPKHYLDCNVLTASQERISWTFDNFERILINFSGGKDSTVLLHLVMDEAIKRNRKVGIIFIDWECQFTLTINHIRDMYNLYKKHIEPYWIALPITTWNGCSQFEPEWTAWDETKKDLWVREKDPISIQDKNTFPFYYEGITFEEFNPLFAKWYSQGKTCASVIGIRTSESLNRFRSITHTKKQMKTGRTWTTHIIDNVWNVYPIYDWNTEDDWIYVSKFNKPYNPLYDRMHQAMMSIHQMRIDEPFGDTQRTGLWLYHIIEPNLWSKMMVRVSGANTGALYSHERGNILGNIAISLPKGHTWESFAMMLLDTMPTKTSEHYKNKIAVYLKWYKTRGYPKNIPDEADMHNKEPPSWKRICKTLLRNDYWCRSLSFSPTKSHAYLKYQKLMKKRRNNWQIFPVGAE